MIAPVGDRAAGRLLRRCPPDLGEAARRRFPGRRELRRPRPERSTPSRRHPYRDRPRAPACRPDASSHSSSWRSWRPGRSDSSSSPVRVRQGLAAALAVEARQVVGRRRCDAALARHPRHVSRQLSPLSRRTIICSAAPPSVVEPSTPSALARHRAALSVQIQLEAEHLVVRLARPSLSATLRRNRRNAVTPRESGASQRYAVTAVTPAAPSEVGVDRHARAGGRRSASGLAVAPRPGEDPRRDDVDPLRPPLDALDLRVAVAAFFEHAALGEHARDELGVEAGADLCLPDFGRN